MNILKQIHIYLQNNVQNYFRDPWNAFDFFIVAGSLVDLGLASINVSCSCKLVQMCY